MMIKLPLGAGVINHLTGKTKFVLNILLGEINIVRVKETPLNVGLEVEELGM